MKKYLSLLLILFFQYKVLQMLGFFPYFLR